jgi:AcrR family transcriptional regulator
MVMTTFQRAHSEEQREIRRQAILQTAATMLTEGAVADISLNELSRRVGLAKSNVLRYFESREAILLSLLTRESEDLLADLTVRLDRAPDRRRAPLRRAAAVAEILVESLAARPTLCELLSAQSAVLERNVSVTVVADFKQTAIDQLRRTADLVHRQLPELDPEDCIRLVTAVLLQIGGVWTACRQTPAVQEFYRSHPELAEFQVDFAETMQDLTVTYAAGLLSRAGAI